MSSYRQTIQAVINKIKTLTELQLVEVYNGQFEDDDIGNGKGFNWPLAFVEIISPNPNNPLSVGVVSAVLTWRIHIGHLQYDAIDGTMEQNLDVYDLRDKFHHLLNGFKPPMSSHFQLISEQRDSKHKAVYHYILDYASEYIDLAGSNINPTTTTLIVKQPPTELQIDFIFPEFNSDFSDDFNIFPYNGSTIYNIRDYII